jgi:hypothetical protein
MMLYFKWPLFAAGVSKKAKQSSEDRVASGKVWLFEPSLLLITARKNLQRSDQFTHISRW